MKSLENINLVIFDCDGVLIDSEPIANRILAECVSELGWPMNMQDSMQHFMGRSIHCIIDIIEARLEKSVPQDFINIFESRMFAAFHSELREIPGARQLIESLTIPFCVATSASHEKLNTSLNIVGLRDHFREKTFSAHDVARGKPAPDLFLHAAQRMNVPPEQCLVIEDSIFGMQAGLAANMATFAYQADLQHAGRTPHGVTTFHSMEEIVQQFRSYGITQYRT